MLGGTGRHFQQGDTLLRLRLPQGSAAASPKHRHLPGCHCHSHSLATTQVLQANVNDQIAHHVLIQRTPYRWPPDLWLSEDVTLCDRREHTAQLQ